MDLKKYLRELPKESREQFALRCGTTLNYMKLIAYKGKKANYPLSIKIEIETNGSVPISFLCPKFAEDLSRAGYVKQPKEPGT